MTASWTGLAPTLRVSCPTRAVCLVCQLVTVAYGWHHIFVCAEVARSVGKICGRKKSTSHMHWMLCEPDMQGERVNTFNANLLLTLTRLKQQHETYINCYHIRPSHVTWAGLVPKLRDAGFEQLDVFVSKALTKKNLKNHAAVFRRLPNTLRS